MSPAPQSPSLPGTGHRRAWRLDRAVAVVGLAVATLLTPRGVGAEPAAAASKAIQITSVQRSTPVDFEKELLPLLRNNCLACHNRTKAKADLVLETPADILKGGESGPAVVPGKPLESLLLKVAAHQEKPYMPPKDNKVEAVDLLPEQLGLLKLWIEQGAKGEVRGARLVVWEALPPGINPILAVAITPDGQLAACGRANQLALYHLPTHQLLERLTDPELIRAGLYTNAGVAHRDMVNSLAFNPAGTMLVSGDYRTAKVWSRRVDEQRRVLAATNLAPATTVAASPDGRWVATGHADGGLAMWDPAGARCTGSWQAHSHAIVQITPAPDGTRLASISGSTRIGIWSVPDGRSLLWIPCPTPLTAVAWSGDGRQVLASGTDQVIRQWRLPAAGETNAVLVRELKGHEARITSLAATAGAANRLLSGSIDGTARVWDLEKGDAIRKVDHGGPVMAVGIRPDGKGFATAGSNSIVRLWSLGDTNKAALELKGDWMAEAAAAARERDLATAKSDVAYRQGVLEEARKREKIEADFASKSLEARLAAEKTLTEKQKAVLAAVEARVAAEKAPAELVAELAKVNESRDTVEAAAVKVEKVAGAARERVDRLRAAADAATKSARDLAKAVEADAGKTPALAAARMAAEKLAADAGAAVEDAKAVAERLAAEAAAPRKAADEAKAQAQKRAGEIAEKQKQAPERLAAAVKAIEAAEKEADAGLIAKRSAEDQLVSSQRAARKAAEAVPEAATALQSAESSVKKLDGDLQAARKVAADAIRPVLALAYGPDSKTVASSGADGALHTWGAESGVPIEVVYGLGAPVTHILPCGSEGYLTLGGTNRGPTLRTRHESWALARTLGTGTDTSPLQGRVNAVQFSPDGKWIATGSGEPSRSGDLMIWEAATGKLLRAVTNAHSDLVLAIDFSPDGRWIATSGADRFVKVWDAATGALSRSFEGHTHHVLGVAWKQDGRTLASAGADKVIKLWNFVTGEQKRTIGGADKEVTSIQYIDATGEALVTSGDAQVRLVAEDGKTVRSFGGASDFVQSAAATADGRWIVGGGQDSVLRFWNGLTGQLIQAFTP
jgi:WD40 repeat protein